MARKPSEIQELAARIEALEAEVRGLREVLTPQMELRVALNRTRKRAQRVPARELARAMDRADREVRRERSSRGR